MGPVSSFISGKYATTLDAGLLLNSTPLWHCEYPFQPGGLVHARNHEDLCSQADVKQMALCAEEIFDRAQRTCQHTHLSVVDGHHLTVARYRTSCMAMLPHLRRLDSLNWSYTIYDKNGDQDNFTSTCNRQGLRGGKVVATSNVGEEALPYLLHLAGGVVYEHEVFAHELEWTFRDFKRRLLNTAIVRSLEPSYLPLIQSTLKISLNGYSSQLHLICAIEHLCKLLEGQNPRCTKVLEWQVAPRAQFATTGAQLKHRQPC